LPIADLSSDIRSYKKIGRDGASHEYLLQRSLAVWVGLAKLVDSEGISRNLRGTERKRTRMCDVLLLEFSQNCRRKWLHDTTRLMEREGKSARIPPWEAGELFLAGSFSVIDSRLLRL